ncbi:MAG: hypothetical protein A2821_02915 [Candidatus Magasanikbacteria bacterium RIFCSPHIGHO2_01_FULL_41_23]|uniref:Glycosyltransferase subfamily 4-like N-terminal domain-containing protein n=1 Tax=Candidatus Magasanikbacteria bacterium RIFCSPLOWO2_01_FULL_40_15 TaxID=1798686 RepID=A0A1F6N472_9BACT|nr:MAG: hypothetical protein A2821_02915 [Candidatus Magasanikbacteria bacterium RIFCSPHIGHO2_01_FULL_41_23]OGH67289.1 MAG: hypothetical protein A3C66_00930 [Candidatus Magasanikbacteria bacterium RIFCSPHIGHO2_02_FULL_41_35]OGH76514.1 MAG: hypothetical protein A3F22_00140 [Candidatus Magasanikbacteria bacterium RIFCSPHIGHO2_12_FULL_41_16]OGH78500.1 MAG: hypothetical protein A2983_03215 [Candidatus Magasanikbacteria bacterium RIFCSPLOWO2_01_FULL_40_15]
MNILIAADIFPPLSGGPATYVVGLANALTAKNVDVKIISLTPQSDITKVHCPIFVVRQKNKILRYLEYIGLLLKHSREADCIYAMGPVNAGLPALVVSILLRKKLIVKVVGDYAWEQGTQRFGVTDLMDDFQTKKYTGAVGWLQRLERLVVRQADQVIVPSNYLRKIVLGWGAHEEKISVIYNAISLSASNNGENVLVKPNIEQWIVTVARLTPWKGIKEIIEVLVELKSQFPNARYKVVGDGPDLDRLKKTIQDCRAENYVELLGNLSHKLALDYMKLSDLVILNSGYEGLSHVLVEALSLDCRVLVSDIGGNPEVVIPGETGDVFPYNNKEIIKEKIVLALNGSMPKPFSAKISRADWFKKFTFETMVSETRTLLEKICAH